jgi:hypothetical protein
MNLNSTNFKSALEATYLDPWVNEALNFRDNDPNTWLRSISVGLFNQNDLFWFIDVKFDFAHPNPNLLMDIYVRVSVNKLSNSCIVIAKMASK